MVAVTTEVADAIRRLRAEEGELIFVQSDGCCDGSALTCFQPGEFRIGHGDALIAEIAGDVTQEPAEPVTRPSGCEITEWSTP